MCTAERVLHHVATSKITGVQLSSIATVRASGVIRHKEQAVSQPERGADLAAAHWRLHLHKGSGPTSVQPQLAAASAFVPLPLIHRRIPRVPAEQHTWPTIRL